MDNFASLDTPGDPRGVKVVELSGMKPKSADSVTVCTDQETVVKFAILNPGFCIEDKKIFLLFKVF